MEILILCVSASERTHSRLQSRWSDHENSTQYETWALEPSIMSATYGFECFYLIKGPHGLLLTRTTYAVYTAYYDTIFNTIWLKSPRRFVGNPSSHHYIGTSMSVRIHPLKWRIHLMKHHETMIMLWLTMIWLTLPIIIKRPGALTCMRAAYWMSQCYRARLLKDVSIPSGCVENLVVADITT